MRKAHPDLWRLLLRWDADSPVRFKARYTVRMLEERFRLEECGEKKQGGSFGIASGMAASHDSTPRSKKAPRACGAYSRGSKTFELFRRMRAFGLLFSVGLAVLYVVYCAIFVREFIKETGRARRYDRESMKGAKLCRKAKPTKNLSTSLSRS